MKPCFAGPNEDLVMMGSEDGKVFVWSKIQGMKLGELCGHIGPVNCVAGHPKIPSIIFTCADDNSVKIWNLIPE